MRAPWLKPWLQRLVGAFVSDHTRVDEAHRIFPKLRGVPFNETEYQIPAEHGMSCLAEVRHAMRRSGEAVFFPVEFRYVKGDDLWLSPFYGRDSVSISVHRYHRQDHRPLFAHVEPVFARYGGRPHWGKLHSLRGPQLRDMYPRWDDFLRVRAQLDPDGKFLNGYMREVLGV
jgi:FAD/FMN-containing dehydrogenase